MDRGRQLLPVPPRPPRSTDVEAAAAHILRAVPALEAPAARALALVELAARTPAEAAAALAVSDAAVAELLARARKELRRASFPLSATGWCERAERLLSDRLDGPLEARAAGRVESHLRNCGRCVEHERRLASARVSLVEGFLAEHRAPAVEAAPAPDAEVSLRAVEPPRAVEPEPEPLPEPESEPEVDVVPPPSPVVEAPRAPARPAQPRREPPAEPAPLRSALAAGGAWYALSVAAVVLTVISVIVTLLGLAGVDRIL